MQAHGTNASCLFRSYDPRIRTGESKRFRTLQREGTDRVSTGASQTSAPPSPQCQWPIDWGPKLNAKTPVTVHSSRRPRKPSGLEVGGARSRLVAVGHARRYVCPYTLYPLRPSSVHAPAAPPADGRRAWTPPDPAAGRLKIALKIANVCTAV
eukprot:1518181-Prymnesium_polylepis.1